MDWLKRNLVLVAVGAVALALLGYGGYLLYAKYQQDAEITGTLQAEMENYNSLQQKSPHPDEKNIKAAREDQKRITDFLTSARRSFAPIDVPESLDNAIFRNLLDNTVSELRADAEKYGVSLESLPPKYGFTFATQLQSVQYLPDTLRPLAIELAEVKELVGILYRANVHGLLGLRRVAVQGEETFGSMDYLVGRRTATDPDTGAVITPYELTFQCFSSELASVLEGLGSSPHCFVVKHVLVDKNLSPTMLAEGGEGMTPPGMDAKLAARYGLVPQASPMTPPGMDAALAQRYGLNRPGIPGGYGSKSDGPQSGGMDARMRSRYGLGPRNPYAPGGNQMQPPGAVATPYPGATIIPGTPGVPYTSIAPGSSPRSGLTTVLDERPLRVTLQVESVRFPTEEETKSKKPPKQ